MLLKSILVSFTLSIVVFSALHDSNEILIGKLLNSSWKQYLKGKIDYNSFKELLISKKPETSVAKFLSDLFNYKFQCLENQKYSNRNELKRKISELNEMLKKLREIDYEDHQVIREVFEEDERLKSWFILRVSDFRKILVWECFQISKCIIRRTTYECPQMIIFKFLWSNLRASVENDDEFLAYLGDSLLNNCPSKSSEPKNGKHSRTIKTLESLMHSDNRVGESQGAQILLWNSFLLLLGR